MIEFVVPGEVVPQGRPRFVKIRDFQRPYDPKVCKDYKALVKAEAQKVAPETPLEGPVMVFITVYRSIPKSWSKKKQQQARDKAIYPVTKPDIDNLAKGIKDALTGVIWHDDSQVVSLNAAKVYGDYPKASIAVWTTSDMLNDVVSF